ncbi:MAG TPA: hypothetical protein VMU39_03880, partial [Solirubrobacteraceae bacterium]|nr:hypothetical protein [Solirubrobacteraceae bacterium]
MRLLRGLVVTGAAVIALGALTSAACADIFALTETVPAAPRTDIDLAEIDASTGTFGQLPAGINTTANEFHPSVSFDGTRVVFERVDPSAGTHRIILADLSTGQTADVFSGLEVATYHPTSPSILGGSLVLTGGPFTAPIETATSSFPALGPYPHQLDGSSSPLTVVDPFVSGISIQGFPESAYRVNVPQSGSSVTLGQIVVDECCDPAVKSSFSNPAFRIFSSSVSFAHPTIAGDSVPVVILFDRHAVSSTGDLQQGDIGFCSVAQAHATSCDTLGLLPPIVDSSANETRPAFTPDGRYIGFIRDESNGHERLFIWDSLTQTMLNGGVDLGLVHTP